jgi:hypothetical protein
MGDHEHQVIQQEQSVYRGETVQPDAGHREMLEKGLTPFIDVGQALAEIRDKGLYRTSYRTFEAYCKERWGMSWQRAFQLVSAAKVVGNIETEMSTWVDRSGQGESEIETLGPHLPTTEKQVRPLARLSGEQQAEEDGGLVRRTYP